MQEIAVLKQNVVVSSSKDDITALVDNYIKDIAINGGDVLKDWVACEKYMFLLKQLQEGLKPFVMNDLQTHDNRESDLLGVKMKVVNTPAKYDYSGNKVWEDLAQKIEKHKDQLKYVETFIKSLKGATTIVDEETGEAFKYYPPAKSSSETVRTSME
jgi:hypothetical protein